MILIGPQLGDFINITPERVQDFDNMFQKHVDKEEILQQEGRKQMEEYLNELHEAEMEKQGQKTDNESEADGEDTSPN